MTASQRDTFRSPGQPDERGSSLIEALLASLLLVLAIVAIAQLFAIAVSTNIEARTRTVATILASQKLEQLRVLAGVALAPGGSLAQNTSGFVEHLDASGIVLGADAQRPRGTVYTRRWSIEPVIAGPDGVWLVQVRVVGNHTLAQLVTVTGSRSE